MSIRGKEIPEANIETVDIPDASEISKDIPKPQNLTKEMPVIGHPENSITLKTETYEIFPTKLKYFRNRTVSIYKLLKAMPLTEFLSYDKGIFDPDRDADQILFDFLVAVFDNARIVRDNYDDMTSEDIEHIIEIFGRLNHIDEKETANRKNQQPQESH